MTVPMEYRRASELFEAFLKELADVAGLETRNQSYTMLEGVFRAFRRRLPLPEAIAFAQLLPPLLRALFVADWDPSLPPAAGWDRELLTREVQGLRRHHNFAPRSAIADTATVLRRHLDAAALEALLARLPEGARAFWAEAR